MLLLVQRQKRFSRRRYFSLAEYGLAKAKTRVAKQVLFTKTTKRISQGIQIPAAAFFFFPS